MGLFRNFAIYFHSFYGYYVSGGRHKVMGKQGTQNPHLTEFILACVEHKDNICIIANWICELQLKHFHKSVKKTEKK